MILACVASVSSRVRRECWNKSKKKNEWRGRGRGKKETLARKRVHLYVECRGSRVPCRGWRVTIFVIFFLLKMKNKWKTNKKNLKNKWRVDISNQISSNCWVVGVGRGKEQNTLLHNLRTSSALLTSHVKNVVKKLKKTDLTDILLSKCLSL